MPALANASSVPSGYTSPSTSISTSTLHKRDMDGGAVGVVLILLAVGYALAVVLFVCCVKQAQARRSEKRGRNARPSKHRGDVPLSLRTYRRTNVRASHATQPVGLGISGLGLEPDLEAGPGPKLPTPPPPSYRSTSLRSQRAGRDGASRHQSLASRTMRSGAVRNTCPRPSQSINEYLQSQARSGSSASSKGARAGALAAAEHNAGLRRESAASRESWER